MYSIGHNAQNMGMYVPNIKPERKCIFSLWVRIPIQWRKENYLTACVSVRLLIIEKLNSTTNDSDTISKYLQLISITGKLGRCCHVGRL